MFSLEVFRYICFDTISHDDYYTGTDSKLWKILFQYCDAGKVHNVEVQMRGLDEICKWHKWFELQFHTSAQKLLCAKGTT